MAIVDGFEQLEYVDANLISLQACRALLEYLQHGPLDELEHKIQAALPTFRIKFNDK